MDIESGSCSLKCFLFIVVESIEDRESRRFEGLNSTVKLSLYRTFSKVIGTSAMAAP